MPDAPSLPLEQQDALQLHARLRAGDPLARHDLSVAFLEPLVTWLGETSRGIAPDLVVEAAEDALIALFHNPDSYDPARLSLLAYLRMSAQGDLRNRLRRERKHHHGRVPWESVEHSPAAGKYLGRDDDPAAGLQLAEQLQELAGAIPAAVRAGLTETEIRVVELMLRKERRTAIFAELLGLQHLSALEQRQVVKRVKERLKMRVKRAGGTG